MYLALPVNGRSEETLKDKRWNAYLRARELRKILADEHPEWHLVDAFDVCPAIGELDEAEAMGRCIALLMTCDGIVMDYNWRESRGCAVEQKVADVYGKEMMEVRYQIVNAHLEMEIAELARVKINGMKF